MPFIVAEGRQVIYNIERSASMFLVKNIFSFVLAILSLFAVFKYPLQPIQLSLISTITIGIPSFLLSLEKTDRKVTGRFISNIILNALPGSITDVLIAVGILLFASAYSIPYDISSTIVSILIAVVGFAVLFKLILPLNVKRSVMFGGLIVIYLFLSLMFPGFLKITPPDFGGWIIIVVFTLLIPSFMFSFDYLIGKIRTKLSERLKAKEQ